MIKDVEHGLWQQQICREHDKSGTFYLLQIRPIVDSKEMLDEDLNEIPDEDVILRSYNSLGHGIMNDIYDVVYVKTDNYSASNNQTIAWEIEKINQQFLNEGKNMCLSVRDVGEAAILGSASL